MKNLIAFFAGLQKEINALENNFFYLNFTGIFYMCASTGAVL
jgi:hypothetical protein